MITWTVLIVTSIIMIFVAVKAERENEINRDRTPISRSFSYLGDLVIIAFIQTLVIFVFGTVIFGKQVTRFEKVPDEPYTYWVRYKTYAFGEKVVSINGTNHEQEIQGKKVLRVGNDYYLKINK
ncbi:hypothetical protein RND61_14790 [Streptomyces sp. TRM76323]|uniref:Uncharacterized protein n=1 Tax=Streptomyces tamarix TaxID=3078565 RepID=A0ABU3QKN1_9ACTN|nr:hypothetical protein [Streptomyces tamarix]MDT9683330.1 hypothetical protein [Streptomyces tamarix]